MRLVRNDQVPKLHNLAELRQAAMDIAALAADDDARRRFIQQNASKWRALRHALWGLNGCKCWYSEALLQADQGHIEHYRPKNAVAGESHPGYWWRAFDWTNLRLSHPTVNIRITDYLTGNLAGKGTYFPLKEGSNRATCESEEVNEIPVLLDPTDAKDCRLLCFDLASGRPIARVSKESDAWLHRRASESIEYYHLDEGTWNVQRKDLIDDINQLCDSIEFQAQSLPATTDAYESSLSELAGYLNHMAEFSSVALQVVRERGLLEHLVPIPNG